MLVAGLCLGGYALERLLQNQQGVISIFTTSFGHVSPAEFLSPASVVATKTTRNFSSPVLNLDADGQPMDCYIIPFRPEEELCKNLDLDRGQLRVKDGGSHLPGQPWVPLKESEVIPYVESELLTPLLNQMSPWLWLVATPKSTHVTALHAQIARGRSVIIAEDPELHLVWIRNKIFIKPLPIYLLSHAFWSYFLFPNRKLSADEQDRQTRILQAAFGFIRTYAHLIKHESDFRIAIDAHLIPQDVGFAAWVNFIRDIKQIEDAQVSGRYCYGELRLTRLNFWATPILGRWQFRKASWQYADHLARYIAPLLFIFTTWSLVLDSMQVGLQSRPNWTRFANVSAWFSVATLIGIVAVAAFLLGILSVFAGREIIYAFSMQIRKRMRRNPTRQNSKIP